MKKTKSNPDYKLRVWWKPDKNSTNRQVLDPIRLKVLNEIKNFNQSPEFLARRQKRLQPGTLADYFISAQNNGLEANNLMYTPEELMKIKVFTLKKSNQDSIKTLILKVNNDSKWIIALHGWGENKYLALHQTYLFSQLGFNVLTFDMMGHGQSYGEETDFGFASHQDIALIIAYLKRTHGMKHYGIIGLSSGASTALRHLQKEGYKDPYLKFVISDCGFSNLNKALQFIIQEHFQLPWWKIGYAVRNSFKKYFGFEPRSFDLLNKKEMIQISEVPVLFIHGDRDDKVDISHAHKLYAKKISFENPKRSQLLIVPRAKHKESITKGNKFYTNGVVQFLKSINQI